MLRAADAYPVNLGLLGKCNSSDAESLAVQIEAGACGLKLHEDWGSLLTAFRVADPGWPSIWGAGLHSNEPEIWDREPDDNVAERRRACRNGRGGLPPRPDAQHWFR
jgi:hypothetical protein